MDFAAMKRRELQALCKEHGLKANGSNADLAARLAATLSISGGAEEYAVGVVVGKGCLKRSICGDSDAVKKVTFVLEEEEEAEVGGRRLLLSPVVARTRGRPRAAEPLSLAQESGGDRRRTRSQVGGDSADETDAGQAGADAVTRRHRRNAANLGAGDVVERVTGAVGRKTSAKAEQQELDAGEAVGRKHQLKRKTRENDADNLDVSVQVGVSRRSTRSSAVQSEPAAAPAPVVHNKRGRKTAGDLKEQHRVKEQPTEIQHVGRTLRSGLVVADPPLPTVSENKRSRSKVPEGKTAVEKVAEVEISGRTTRSSSVPAAATSPIVVAKKRRKTKNVNSDEGQHMVPDVSNDAPVTRVLRNRAIQTIGSTDLKVARPTMLNAAKDSVEDGVAKQDGHVGSKKRKMSNRKATVATNGGEIPFSDSNGKASAMDMHVEVPGPVRRSMRKSVVPSFLEHETKGMRGDVEMKETVTKPVGRSTRRSLAPVILEKESKGLTKPVEIKETVTKPVGRSSRRSVATVILEKECKVLPKEMIPQVHVKRPTKKSLVSAMTEKGTKSIVTDMIPEARAGRSTRKPALAIVNSKKNDHCEAASSEKCSSAKSEDLEKQRTVKQPVRRLTRKSFVPAVLEKDRKAVPADMNPDPQFNNENGDHTKMKCAKGGHLEKQLLVKEPSRRSKHKSVAPHVIEKELKGLQEESKSEVPVSTSVRKPACPNAVDKESKDHREIVPHVIEKDIKGSQEESNPDVPVRTSVRKPAGPNAVDKESKDHSEIVRREESSVRTRSAQTKLQRSVQNDASLRQTRHRSSKLAISPLPSKPTASKGRPAKRSRTASLEEVMPAEEQKEDQIACGGHTSDMIDVASSANSLESGVLPSPAEKCDLRDSQLNTQLEGTVVESSISHGKDISNILEVELESTVVGTTEKPPSDLAIPDCTHVGALSEEALDSIENDAARCSPDLEQSPTGLQFLFSQGNIEEPDTDNTSPFFKNVMEESDVHKVECQVETVVSLKPDSYQGSDEYSIRIEESGGLMFSSQQNNEQEGFSLSTLRKDWVASVQLDLSEDVHHTVRDTTRKDVICNEEEETDLIPSDINAPHEKSHADEPAEHVSGVSGALFCISQSTVVVDEVNSDSSPLESVDALDNHIASSNTEGLQQDNIEECNLHNARVTEDIHASVTSEAAQVAVPESGKMLQPDVETLVLPDEQLKRKLEGDDLEVQSFSRGKDESPKQSTSCEDQSFLGSGICQTVSRRYTDVVCVKDHKDECNQHMSEPALDERSEGGMSVLRAEETSPFPDEQLNTKLEGNTEQGLICDKDSSNVSLTEFLGNNHVSSLKDPTMDPCYDQELPNDMPAPKSPEESAVFLDDKVSGSVQVQSLSCDKDGSIVSDTGSLGNKNLSSMKDPSMDPCHVQELPSGPSMDPCHDQGLPGGMPAPKSPDEFAVSMDERVSGSVGICQISASIGKGNHIAMDPHHTVKQVDNLSHSAAALLRNMENTPCKPDALEPSSDHLFVIDSSTPMEPLLTEAGLKVGCPDKKLPMEQVQQDDLQVQEGTVEKTSLGSATPECKHECVSPDKAGPRSLKNERYPSSIEQSLFDQQSLSLQEDVQVHEGTPEKTALGSTTPECKDECGFPDEADPHSLKNGRGSLIVEQSPCSLPTLFTQESVEERSKCVVLSSARFQAQNGVCESNPGSDHDTSADFSTVSKSEDCLDTSQQDNENEGLLEASHEQDDFQVQEGNMEKTTLGSDLPECKHEFGLPAEAEPHSLMNQRSSIEQSAFGPQSLILKEGGQGTVENTAVDSATPECKHECVSPDKAGPHSLKNERYPLNIAQSSFDLQPFSSQDDVQVHEGTLQKTALGSATPECKDEYGFPDEADPHSLKNERGSLGVEQPLSLPSLFSEESIEEPSECVALSSASVQAETGVNESKPGLDHDTSVDFSTVSKSEDCLVTSQQDNENEGLMKASHEQEQVATGQLDLEAASITEDADSEEVAYDEENKKPVDPTDINSSCQKINVSGPVEHASGLGDALLSPSLIACTDDSDVHLSSNPCLFESTDFPDEIDWSNTEALQQGLQKQQCDERKEYQVPFGAGNDMIEAGTKDIDSVVPPLPAEETSNMRDEQFNTKLPGTEVAEFGLSCNKGGNNYLDTESVVNSCRNIPSDSSLPTDCSTDDYQQMELFEGPAEQKSPEDASVCWEDSVPRAVSATIEKPSPSFDLAIPDFKHEGALSEEAVYSIKNDTESCSRDHRRSSIGLHPLFSEESFKGPDVDDDLVLPSTENEDDSNICHAEKMVSSEPDSHQGSPVDLSIVEEIKGMFSSERDDEQGFLSSGQKTECIASARLDSSEDCNLVKRDINTEVICKEEEKLELVPYSDTHTLHETSNTDEPDEQKITLLHAAETSASADKQLSSELEEDEFKERNFSSEETIGIFGVGSVKSNLFHLHEDSHTNPIQGKELPDNVSAPKSPEQSMIGHAESLLGSGICQTVVQRSTEEINTKLQHERKEEGSKYIDDQTTLMSECALFGGSVSGTTLLLTAETSSLPDEQFGPELEFDAFEEPDHSYDENASYLFGSGSQKNNVPNLGHKEEYYEHSDDPAILSSGMPKPSLSRESESGVALKPAEETPALTNENPNFKMEELGLCISDMSDTGLMENNNLSCLPKDTYMETWNKDEISIGTPAAKSPGKSAVCPDDRVPGSVGICQTSGRRRIDEISTKLLSFKISSAVKGSYISMDSADDLKQGDNLSPAALPGNWENVPAAKADNPAKQNSDCSVAKDNSS
ncbi:hypothetical protein CFC21_070741 [Triticum aestivum]|uniref:SAP domain-containing protein n=2 Tax=Triticum aestivum TaxID=4565 RepID=A0A9R1HFF8_WHEAT|nr:uncharacterized protein LOC123111095 isoform X3 [Triticum aestivum]KAF7064429.1 hypothetical protein CFC21_070741 [Triticum aestivum]